MKTRFTLILATYGRITELDAFLESIVRQTYSLQQIEIIIADQNDEIDLKPLVTKYSESLNIKHLKIPSKGLSNARNLALEVSSGEIIAFPDDDCEYYPNTLEQVDALFQENPSCEIFLGRIVDANGVNILRKWKKLPFEITKNNFYLNQSSITIFSKRNKLCFDTSIGLGTFFGSSEDADYVFQALNKNLKILYNPDIKVFHPETTKNIHKSKSYGLGFGAFCKKNFSFKIFLWMFFSLFYHISKLLLSSITFNSAESRLNFVNIKYRIKGFLEYPKDLAPTRLGNETSLLYNNDKVEVLMATYNGGKYIREQLDSILQQSHSNISILVSDDSSTDNTRQILEDYKKQFPDKIQILPSQNRKLGIIGNFSYLLEHSKEDYTMFADQDDVWLPHKISAMLERMKHYEAVNGKNTPILVHSDLIVTDEKLNVISSSLWDFQKINPRLSSFNRILVENTITGCASIFNRALTQLITPIPVSATLHDWWLGLVASALGKVYYMNQQTVLYRQHGNNVLGAKTWNLSYIAKMIKNSIFTDEIKKVIHKSQRQAKALAEIHRENLSKNQFLLLNDYSQIDNKGYLHKVLFITQNRIFKRGLLKNIGLFYSI